MKLKFNFTVYDLSDAMLKVIPCIYQNGELIPQIPVDFPEGAKVQIAYCRHEVDSAGDTQNVDDKSENGEKESAEGKLEGNK